MGYEEPAPEEPYNFDLLKEYITKLRFRSSPGGFLLITENKPEGNEVALAQTQGSGKENSDPQQSSFSVEDYHNCHKWEDLVTALKDKQGPIFVILDLTWTKIEGGNKRQLVMIEWQQKDMSYTVARAICRRFAMHFQVLANSLDDLNINKIKDFVSKGAAIGTK